MSWSTEVHALITTPCEPQSPSWAQLPLCQRWRVAQFLGALERHGLDGKPLKKASCSLIAREQEHVNAGAIMLTESSDSVHRLLARLRQGAGCRNGNPSLIDQAFPGLLTMMRYRLKAEERNFLMPFLTSYVASDRNNGTPVSWRPKGQRAQGSAKAIAHALNIRPERAIAMLHQSGSIASVRTSASGRRMLVASPSQILTLKAKLADDCSQTAMARRCGLSVPRLVKLAQSNLIQATQAGGLSARSMQTLFDQVVCHASNDIPKSTNWLPLTEALRLLVPQAETVPFMADLIAGAISLCRKTVVPASFADLLVRRCQVRQMVSAMTTSQQAHLTLPQAAKRLSLKQEVIYHLVNHGLLVTNLQHTGRRAARCITVNELSRFKALYAPLAALAKQAGVGSRASLTWAASTGLELVSGPSIDGGRQYLVRRSQGSR